MMKKEYYIFNNEEDDTELKVPSEEVELNYLYKNSAKRWLKRYLRQHPNLCFVCIIEEFKEE